MIKDVLNRQEGWSPPFTWILLIIIILLVYFFGWMVLLVVAGIFVLITLGVFIYDHLTASPDFNDNCFWFVSDRSLNDIWQILTPVLRTGEYEIEGENVWEWIDVPSRDHKFVYNITRKHKDFDHPVILRIRSRIDLMSPERLEILGGNLVNALDCEVNSGTVTYIDGNNYEFKVTRTFKGNDANRKHD